MKFILFAAIIFLSSPDERREVIRSDKPDAKILITANSDTLAIEFSDRSGEKNGFKIIAYRLSEFRSIVIDSAFIVGNDKSFDDSTLFCNLKSRQCGVRRKVFYRPMAQWSFRDYGTEKPTPDWSIGLTIILDRNAKSLFGDEKSPGAYLQIRGDWKEYRRFN